MSSRVVASKARPVAAGKTGDHEGTALATISIVTGCYNEEDNVAELAARVRAVLESLPDYEYEHIFIDNASTDGTADVLRRPATSVMYVLLITGCCRRAATPSAASPPICRTRPS